MLPNLTQLQGPGKGGVAQVDAYLDELDDDALRQVASVEQPALTWRVVAKTFVVSQGSSVSPSFEWKRRWATDVYLRTSPPEQDDTDASSETAWTQIRPPAPGGFSFPGESRETHRDFRRVGSLRTPEAGAVYLPRPARMIGFPREQERLRELFERQTAAYKAGLERQFREHVLPLLAGQLADASAALESVTFVEARQPANAFHPDNRGCPPSDERDATVSSPIEYRFEMRVRPSLAMTLKAVARDMRRALSRDGH